MPCGGPKNSPRTSSTLQIIFSVWSFEISEGVLRNQKIIVGLDSFSNLRLIYLAPFCMILVFVSTTLLKDAKLLLFTLAPCCQIYRVTKEAEVAETTVWPILLLIYMFTALKGSLDLFLFIKIENCTIVAYVV